MYRSPFNAASYQTTAFEQKGKWKCGYHTGVDRVCSSDTALVSIGNGVVESINACGQSYGYHIVLRIDGKYSVLYAHLRANPIVKVGSKVTEGQPIGNMGNTGNSSGPHLHIEIQNGSKWAYAKNLLNPNTMIDWNRITNIKRPEKDEGEYMSKTWKNGGTKEFVFSTTDDCKKQTSAIGYISPGETAVCRGVTSGCYLVEYLTPNRGHKVGYVKYHGGII